MKDIFSELDQYGKKLAIVTAAEKSVSYATLLADSKKFASGIPERSLVFLLCGNNYESIIGYIGTVLGHCVPVLLDDKIEKHHLIRLIGLFDPKYIYLPLSRTNIVNSTVVISNHHDYGLLARQRINDYEIHNDLFQLLSTSGSTGSAKYVRQSYRNVESNIGSIKKYLGIRKQDRVITTMPMHYSYGLSMINTHLASGSTIVLSNYSVAQKQFWDVLRNSRITTFGGVAFTYEILSRIKFGRYDLDSVRYITHAGGALNRNTTLNILQMCKENDIRFYTMYGQTEASPRMTYLPWERAFDKIGSIGISIPGGLCWLENEDGGLIKMEYQEGEIVYQGPNVALGYGESYRDLAKGDDNQNILRTGDIGYKDEEGYLFLVGRKSRFVKVYGHRVSLDDIEQVMLAKGVECACTGNDDSITIYVTQPNLDDWVLSLLSDVLPRVDQRALSVVYVSTIPRDVREKINYSALK